jgi:hypothetical protein
VCTRERPGGFSAAPLMLKLTVENPFRGVDFFETDNGGLVIGG